jgi:hypothetical protein
VYLLGKAKIVGMALDSEGAGVNNKCSCLNTVILI